jgi:hypothetical protein
MPGIITPNFPLAGSMRPSCPEPAWDLLAWDLLEEDFASPDLNSTLGALFTVLVVAAADFFTFAIFELLPL